MRNHPPLQTITSTRKPRGLLEKTKDGARGRKGDVLCRTSHVGKTIQMCHVGRSNEEHLVRQDRLSNNNDKVLINVAHHLKKQQVHQLVNKHNEFDARRLPIYGLWLMGPH